MKRGIPGLFALYLLCSTIVVNGQYETRYYLPHIANGRFSEGVYKTAFIFFNNTDAPASARLELTGDDGQPLPLTIPGLGIGSNFSISLEPGSARFYQTDGAGDLVAGAATVRVDSYICVSAVFSIYDTRGNFVTEAGVGSSEPQANFVIPVDVTGNFNTGLAFFNPGTGSASIDLSLLDEKGREASKTTISLGAGAHLARFVGGPGQFFPQVSGFRGTLSVQSDSPVAAVTLRLNESSLCYTSLPVVSKNGYPEPVGLAQVANGSFDGGSYRTSFLIFNVSPVSTTVSLTLTKSDGSPFSLTFPGTGTGSSFELNLEPNASIFLQSDGSGSLATGGARITSPQLVGISAIFSVFASNGRFLTEAGVSAARPEFTFTLPVEIGANFETGVAFFNPSDSTAVLTLRLLRQDGETEAESARITLSPLNQVPKFISQIFPGVTDFRGSLAVSSQTNIVALTLRQNSVPLSYTTLPVGRGTSMGKIHPLLPKTLTGITATSNVEVNESLSTGFKLSGKIYGSGYPSAIAAQADTGEVYYGQLAGSVGAARYLLVLPEGTFSIKACFSTLNAPANVTCTDPTPVKVTGDSTKDITLTQVSLTGVSGRVSGLGTLPATLLKYLVLNMTDDTVWVQTPIDESGNYTCQVPPGAYRANLYMQNVQLPGSQVPQLLTIFNLGTATVSGAAATANFTLPSVSKLTGSLPLGSVYADDRSAPDETDFSCGYFPAHNSTFSDTSGQYQMLLADGRSYDVYGAIVASQGTDFAGILRIPAPPFVVPMAGDSRLDFTVPTLPGTVEIYGRVTSSSGRGVNGVQVAALSQSITGVSSGQLSNEQITDVDGKYRIVVLSGTNYQLRFTPPRPVE